MTTPVPPLLSVPEAAARLGCSPRWLADQARAQLVPHRRIGGKRLFTEDDVAAIVRQAAVETVRALRTSRRSA